MGKLRCGVVGVGYLGRFHAQKYQKVEGCELVCVSDANADRANEIAKELNVAAYPDYKALLGKVDAVTIAATTRTHYDIAKFFLSSGIHVNVEKPMTETVAQAQELVDIARSKNLRLQVGHVERFNPVLRSVRTRVTKPFFIECHRLAPFKPRGVDVDVVLDLMIHDLDVILSLVQSPVTSVSAVGAPVLTKLSDMANARLEFANGAVANVTSSRVSQNAMRKFRVFQRNQYLSLDFATNEANLTTKTGEWTDDKVPLEFESWNLEKGDALFEETKSFVEAVIAGRDCEVPGEDGLTAISLASRVQEDIRRRMKLMEP